MAEKKSRVGSILLDGTFVVILIFKNFLLTVFTGIKQEINDVYNELVGEDSPKLPGIAAATNFGVSLKEDFKSVTKALYNNIYKSSIGPKVYTKKVACCLDL